MASTFQDGFPLDPSLAVETSTFLSQQERDDWVVWLKTATPEEKAELVNTLHEIWLEEKSKTQSSLSPTPPPAPAVVSVIQTSMPVDSLPPTIDIPAPPVNTSETIAEIVEQEPLQSFTPPPLPPKPQLAQETPVVAAPSFTFKAVEEKTAPQLPPKPAQVTQKQFSKQQQDFLDEQEEPESNYKKEAIGISRFADLGELQTDKTRSVLDSYLEEFKKTRRNEESQLGKLRDAVLGIEQVVNYSDLLAEKILALNNARVADNKQYATDREEILGHIEDVHGKVDDVRSIAQQAQEEIDRLLRRQKTFESKTEELLVKINSQLAEINSDEFTSSDKLEIMSRKLSRIEQSIPKKSNATPQVQNNVQDNRNAPPKPRQEVAPVYQPAPKSAREMLGEMEVPTLPPAPKSANFMPLNLGGGSK